MFLNSMSDRNNDNKISVYSNLLRKKEDSKEINKCLTLGRGPNIPKPPPPSVLATFLKHPPLRSINF